MIYKLYRDEKKPNIEKKCSSIEESTQFQICIKTISDELTNINFFNYGYSTAPRRDFRLYMLAKMLKLINNYSKEELRTYFKLSNLNLHIDSVKRIDAKIGPNIVIDKINELYRLLYIRNK